MSDTTHITRNYMAHGGNELVIGGKLTILEDAEVTGLAANPLTAATADALGGVKVGTGLSIENGILSVTNPLTAAANQADSSATTVSALKDDLNALIAKLINAGLMAEADDTDD